MIIGAPVWTAHNRDVSSTNELPARHRYIEHFLAASSTDDAKTASIPLPSAAAATSAAAASSTRTDTLTATTTAPISSSASSVAAPTT